MLELPEGLTDATPNIGRAVRRSPLVLAGPSAPIQPPPVGARPRATPRGWSGRREAPGPRGAHAGAAGVAPASDPIGAGRAGRPARQDQRESNDGQASGLTAENAGHRPGVDQYSRGDASVSRVQTWNAVDQDRSARPPWVTSSRRTAVGDKKASGRCRGRADPGAGGAGASEANGFHRHQTKKPCSADAHPADRVDVRRAPSDG
jgi:hypothetical protein